jgi:hypothetical protein
MDRCGFLTVPEGGASGPASGQQTHIAEARPPEHPVTGLAGPCGGTTRPAPEVDQGDSHEIMQTTGGSHYATVHPDGGRDAIADCPEARAGAPFGVC